MKYNKNRRFILTLYLAAASTALLTGFTSFADRVYKFCRGE